MCSVLVCISVYLSNYSAGASGGQLAGQIMCLNSAPEGRNQTTLWGGGKEGGSLTAQSYTNETKHITSLYQCCFDCQQSGMWLAVVPKWKCVFTQTLVNPGAHKRYKCNNTHTHTQKLQCIVTKLTNLIIIYLLRVKTFFKTNLFSCGLNIFGFWMSNMAFTNWNKVFANFSMISHFLD